MDGADEWEFPEADSAYIRSEFPNVDWVANKSFEISKFKFKISKF